ncbi:hypothetical protein K435DRAFT_797950 [Dendrothele bispora CBS 962.96]|uniref:Uncharacterized protein n=1 Tax=Dendrothele bispora (strain CBS 962.96) TaxID=1314807 RepID=A0A4S8M1E7_DENBC|nr:hypothetical protein K435DRAFT_797950 [Dendrothele bispora CBS 962.96]
MYVVGLMGGIPPRVHWCFWDHYHGTCNAGGITEFQDPKCTYRIRTWEVKLDLVLEDDGDCEKYTFPVNRTTLEPLRYSAILSGRDRFIRTKIIIHNINLCALQRNCLGTPEHKEESNLLGMPSPSFSLNTRSSGSTPYIHTSIIFSQQHFILEYGKGQST